MKAEKGIGGIGPGKVTVVRTSKITIAELNYLILRELLSIRKSRVLFISVAKPHHYMTHLLALHGISQRGITYLDVEKSKLIKFPIKPRDMKNFQICGFLMRDFIILQDYEYVVVDDIEHLTHLWTDEMIREFVTSIKEEASKYGTGIVLPVKGKEGTLYEFMKEVCDREINLDEVVE